MPKPNDLNLLARLYQSAVTDEQKKKVNSLLGLLEVGGNFASGSLAQLGGGLSYLPAAAMGGNDAGQAVMRSVQDAYTYQPRSDAGQRYLGALGNLVGPIAKSGSVGAQTFADNVYNATGSPVLGAAARTAPTAIDQLLNRPRLGALGDVRKNDITAYNGSPNDFDEFSMEHIGSGDGGQVRGHGLYFAGDPTTSIKYKERTVAEMKSAHANAQNWVSRLGEDTAKEVFSDYAKNAIENGQDAKPFLYTLKMIESGEYKNQSPTFGRLYTVDIADDQVAKMLDWDKKLSDHSPEVRNSFARAYLAHFGKAPPFSPEEITGGEAYKMLSGGAVGQPGYEHITKQTSELLMKKGIPGIRYIDERSRGTGSESPNYVVFDDKIVKILRKE